MKTLIIIALSLNVLVFTLKAWQIISRRKAEKKILRELMWQAGQPETGHKIFKKHIEKTEKTQYNGLQKDN